MVTHFMDESSSNHNKRKTQRPGTERGRDADKPRKIPRTGWQDIFLRMWKRNGEENVSIIAAGVAFYAFLAIFPGFAAFISLYGLISDPTDVQQQLTFTAHLLPQEAYTLLTDQLSRIVSESGEALSLGLVGGLLLSFWSASRGIKAMMTALNIAYHEEDNRGFIQFNLIGFLLTIAAVVFMLISLAVIAAIPAILNWADWPGSLKNLISYVRWPVIAGLVIIGLGLLYRYSPDRKNAQLQWVSWGAIIATTLWVIFSLILSYYVSNFGSYNKTYGSVGAIIILMMWFYVSAYMVLIGALFDAELEEHQTQKDSTVGEPKPLGERGAHVADTVGEQP